MEAVIENIARSHARRDEAYNRAYDAEMHLIREERAKEFTRRVNLGLEKRSEFDLYVPKADDDWNLTGEP